MNLFKKSRSQKELTALSDELNKQVARNVSSRVEGINYLVKVSEEKSKQCFAFELLAFQIFEAIKEYAMVNKGHTFFIVSNIDRPMPEKLRNFFINACGTKELSQIKALMYKALEYSEEATNIEENHFDAYLRMFNICSVLGEYDKAKYAITKMEELWVYGYSPDLNQLKQLRENLPNEKKSLHSIFDEMSYDLADYTLGFLKPSFHLHFEKHIKPIVELIINQD